MPHLIVSAKEHMGTPFLLPGIVTESAMELIVVDSFQSSSHKVLAEFQRLMLMSYDKRSVSYEEDYRRGLCPKREVDAVVRQQPLSG